MIRNALCALVFTSCIVFSACNTDPGPYLLSGSVARSSAGVPDNCLVALYETDSVNISTSLPDPVYSTTISFTSSSETYSIDNIPSGTYYLGAFLGVNSGTAVSTAESGYGASSSYAISFPLIGINIRRDTVVNIEASDWVGFP